MGMGGCSGDAPVFSGEFMHPLKTSYLNSLVKATRDSTFLLESITYSNVLNIFQLGIYVYPG